MKIATAGTGYVGLPNAVLLAQVINDLSQFKRLADVIVVNRITDEILDVADRFTAATCLEKTEWQCVASLLS